MLLLGNNLLLLLLLSNLVSLQASLFTDPQKLAFLFKQEEGVISRLDKIDCDYKSARLAQYITMCKPRLRELSVLDKFDQESEDIHMDDTLNLLVSNPVHVYSLIDRLVNRLPLLISELINQTNTVTIGESIKDLLDEVEQPSEKDMEGVSQALTRIQFAYRCAE